MVRYRRHRRHFLALSSAISQLGHGRRKRQPYGLGRFGAEAGHDHLYCRWLAHGHFNANFSCPLKGLERMIDVRWSIPIWANTWPFEDAAWRDSGSDIWRPLIYMKSIAGPSPAIAAGLRCRCCGIDSTARLLAIAVSEIIRMFNSAFDGIGALQGDYTPGSAAWANRRDQRAGLVAVNNGVYKAGFATNQGVYERAVPALFDCLDELELSLSRRRYLLGERITESDWRLFTTLIRFDSVYNGHFKCNLRRLVDYPTSGDLLGSCTSGRGSLELSACGTSRSTITAATTPLIPTVLFPRGRSSIWTGPMDVAL